MFSIKKSILLIVFILFAILAVNCNIFASEFPNKPITLIVSHPAGGIGYIACHLFADVAKKYLDEKIIVITKEGGASAVALSYFDSTPKDGYTVLEAPSGLFTSQPHTTEYDFTIEDYEYIAGMIDIPIVVIVRSESPFKSLKDITEVAKEQPGGLICATTGSGGIPHLGMIHIAALSDNLENIIVVPTGGSALAVQQCLGGHVDFAVVHPSDILQHVEAGTIRPLAVLSEKRLEILPDVPTAVEEGFDDVVHSGWLFLLAHKDAPEEHLDKLKEVSKKVLHDEEFLEKAEKAGMTVNYRSPEENKKELERLYILYGELVKMIVVK